ncbi:hypothetical protein NDU88_000678 [Pleurodeles waltl]|uniref:Uncharacterized protein n=1 Tax=Pleurodeles waltl TaxID=8319 RepID=A0AAV7KRE7_PLEWA|nr:hypothetical protein NDU88_000678 [Pleurodeles waltl]
MERLVASELEPMLLATSPLPTSLTARRRYNPKAPPLSETRKRAVPQHSSSHTERRFEARATAGISLSDHSKMANPQRFVVQLLSFTYRALRSRVTHFTLSID